MSEIAVSETCELYSRGFDVPPCGQPAAYAYPAMGGGYCSLCAEHAIPHIPICVTIEQAKRGEKPDFARRAVRPAPTEEANDPN